MEKRAQRPAKLRPRTNSSFLFTVKNKEEKSYGKIFFYAKGISLYNNKMLCWTLFTLGSLWHIPGKENRTWLYIYIDDGGDAGRVAVCQFI